MRRAAEQRGGVHIRQILGWQEWIWHLYWCLGPDYLDRNAPQARAELPEWWRDLDASAVTARCLHEVLAGVRERGWAHHIQRLMILGNHALQRGYAPRAQPLGGLRRLGDRADVVAQEKHREHF